MRKKVSVIFGTRPEAIKLCPLINALREHPAFTPHTCVTGQHRQMLDQVLEVFDVVPDVDMDLMEPNQTLAALTARAIFALDDYFRQQQPDMVLVQGDTTTVLCASLVAFYHKTPVGHVEAGLRTGSLSSPFPEEANRVLTSRLAGLHFAPTVGARENLLAEGIDSERIFVTGNTVVDALLLAVRRIRQHPPQIPGLPPELMTEPRDRPLVLITGHRRENFGRGFESICTAITTLARKFPETVFVYPAHLNPNVREPVFRHLSGLPGVYLIEPLSYLPFVAMMDRATVILTDSGGVQEEAPSLGKPVLVMRDTTERPEAVEAGTVKLVGTDTDRIVEATSALLTDAQAYAAMAKAVNPYGDGKACARIVQAIVENA